ncbi:Suppressor of Sensor Kinase (SLN1) [Cryptotrichosporon argae]
MFAQFADDSSSDEGVEPGDAEPPGHSRTSSYPGTTTSPTVRLPKLNRAATYSTRPSASTAAPGPSNYYSSDYQQWKTKYRSSRARSSVSQPSRPEDLPDWGSDDDDGQRSPLIQAKVILADSTAPDTDEGRERLEWQSMLGSVLLGDILRGESSRIGVERPSSETYRKELGENMWWEIRARLRGRTAEEERRRVEQRRNRVVDAVLEELDQFSVKRSPGPAGVGRRLSAEDEEGKEADEADEAPLSADDETLEISAIDQVQYILHKLSLIERLYQHQLAFRTDKALYGSPAIQARVDALSAWSTVVMQLQAQLAILQAWTGTDDLDLTRPNTTKEKPLVGRRFHPLDAKAHDSSNQAADDSTFVERVLKEDSLQNTFEKRIFGEQLKLIHNAKDAVITHSPLFTALKLPDFQYELVRLIGFPGRLILEALKLRLNAAARLNDPEIMVIDGMIDNFRVSISLAVLIRKQYDDIMAPDPERRWDLPDCLADNYDDVLLEGLKTFFRLLHLKLRSGSKAVYFRETEVLEDEWEFLYEHAEAIAGGDLLVAESLCSLTNKLMGRCISYINHSHETPQNELAMWYGKVLDGLKMRYRKLQRFARRLTQRFDNSAEYALDNVDIDDFIEHLQQTGHFFVYTDLYEEHGTYIVADGTLWERPAAVRQLLFRAFFDRPVDRADDDDVPEYILLISPRQNFAWTTGVMRLEIDRPIDFMLEDNRVRLVANGPLGQLARCKTAFTDSFMGEDDEPLLQIDCVVEQQAHLPRVQRELKKITRSNQRLSENIIESAASVSTSLRGIAGTQDLIQNWYTFASDHGQRVGVLMDPVAWARFSRLLMRLAISWLGFICDHCDPTDRKTFRWTVNALEYAMLMTRGNNILHLDPVEFETYRARVGNCMTLLISHFDILGARSSIEAKKEAERLEAVRRMQRLHEHDEDEEELLPRKPNTAAVRSTLDRSLRLVREERLRLISELEQQRAGLSNDQHLIGQVLDEEVVEDRALVFLAASSSNISLRWQQGGFIGGGANGSVYIGFNLDSGGIMAVKEIRVQDLTNSPALYKQIKDEADVMQMLSHPNIVDYYGIEVHRDRVYIFEEYCSGGSLANLLEHGRIEDEEVIIVYAWQMLQGLQYLHSKGVEHRDVKPDNILLSANSVVKFVDFGAAKVIIKGNRTMARTRAFNKKGTDAGPAVMNSLAGTPMYIAPEVIKGGAGRLGSADIWSLGCVVLEVATGRKPWSNLDNEWAIMFHIGIATQHPPLPEPGQLSELGIDFIERCLELDPEKRPSAGELMQHPWLEMMSGMGDHADAGYTDDAYEHRLAEMTHQTDGMGLDEDLGSFDTTPAESTAGSGEVME